MILKFYASWFKVNLGDAILAHEALLVLKTYLSNIYEVQERAKNKA